MLWAIGALAWIAIVIFITRLLAAARDFEDQLLAFPGHHKRRHRYPAGRRSRAGMIRHKA